MPGHTYTSSFSFSAAHPPLKAGTHERDKNYRRERGERQSPHEGMLSSEGINGGAVGGASDPPQQASAAEVGFASLHVVSVFRKRGTPGLL